MRAVAITRLRGKALRTAVTRVRGAKVAQAQPAFAANARASAAVTGKPLAATGNPATDAQLSLLCSLLSSSSSH